ncbi:MAG: class I SAM-dependent methyltransferase [Candidatus Aenigmarchaeota archaeon]|nr:class I SAM-dependent methyltransferase [Candidatus Aenigmarchaeota archaeon]
MEHYFTKSPGPVGTIKIITALINGANYRFATAGGVFSKDRVDRGTLLLIESVRVSKNDKILDLGCGYGVIGIAFSKYVRWVFMTDINERAVELAKLSVELNKLTNVKVFDGDLYESVKGVRFDKIMCNPPIRAGKAVVNKIIEGALERLEAGGSLYLVARTKQGAKSIAKKMKQVFGNQEYASKSGGYRVMFSRKG